MKRLWDEWKWAIILLIAVVTLASLEANFNVFDIFFTSRFTVFVNPNITHIGLTPLKRITGVMHVKNMTQTLKENSFYSGWCSRPPFLVTTYSPSLFQGIHPVYTKQYLRKVKIDGGTTMALDVSLLKGFVVVFIERGRNTPSFKAYGDMDSAMHDALYWEKSGHTIISVCPSSDLLRLPPWAENEVKKVA